MGRQPLCICVLRREQRGRFGASAELESAVGKREGSCCTSAPVLRRLLRQLGHQFLFYAAFELASRWARGWAGRPVVGQRQSGTWGIGGGTWVALELFAAL